MSTTSLENKKTSIVRYQEHGINDQEVALAIRKVSNAVEKLSKKQPVEPTYKLINGEHTKIIAISSILGLIGTIIGGFYLGVTVDPLLLLTPVVPFPLFAFFITNTPQKFGKPRFFWTRKMRRNLANNLAHKAKYELECEDYKQEIASMTEKIAPQLKLLNEKNHTTSFSIDQETGKLLTVAKNLAIDALRPTEIAIIEKFNAL